ATDNCGNAVVTFTETRVNGTCDNNFVLTRIWAATDNCGNETTHTQTITVNDDVNPVFVGTLPANVTVSCSSEVPVAAVLTATDNCGTATVTLDETSTAGSCANNYTITRIWTAEDACGNIATYEQIITVNDQTAPVIMTPAQNLSVECDGLGNIGVLTAWLTNNAGATATDNCGVITWTNNYDVANFVPTCGNAG